MRIIEGNCLEELCHIAPSSIQCCVTSPPYFNQRDYQTAAWVSGNNAGCDHVADPSRTKTFGNPEFNKNRPSRANTKIFGHYYDKTCGRCGATRIDAQIGREATVAEYVQTLVDVFNRVHRVLKDDGTLWLNLGDTYSSGGDFKPKNLLMIPSRVAIALQDAGWYLRSQIVWAKGNPIPESMKDRPTSSWESIFLLAKNERYYYDQDAVRCDDGYGANCRNLWHVNPRPYKGAHFATMPSEIATRCVLAGSRAGDAILDPFAGAGTTGVVAKQHDRDATLIELNPDYVDIINSRLLDTQPVRPDIPFLTWR